MIDSTDDLNQRITSLQTVHYEPTEGSKAKEDDPRRACR
jgi:hypothetical protein